MKLNKIIKWGMLALILVSVGLLIWGFAKGFAGNAVDVLLYWTYIMLGLAVFSWVVIGLIVGTKNDPKSLEKAKATEEKVPEAVRKYQEKLKRIEEEKAKAAKGKKRK